MKVAVQDEFLRESPGNKGYGSRYVSVAKGENWNSVCPTGSKNVARKGCRSRKIRRDLSSYEESIVSLQCRMTDQGEDMGPNG